MLCDVQERGADMLSKFLSGAASSSENIDLTSLFNSDLAKAIGKYLGIVEDIDGKINKLIESEYKAGISSLEQAMHSQKEQESLLREARSRLNKAVHLEKGAKLAMAYLGLAMCHEKLGDEGNAKLALKKITEIPSSLLGAFFKDNKIEQIQQQVYTYLGERSPQEVDTLWADFLKTRQDVLELEEKKSSHIFESINKALDKFCEISEEKRKKKEERSTLESKSKSSALISFRQSLDKASVLDEVEKCYEEMSLFQQKNFERFQELYQEAIKELASQYEAQKQMQDSIREICISYEVFPEKDDKNIKLMKSLCKDYFSALLQTTTAQEQALQQVYQCMGAVIKQFVMENQRNQMLLQQKYIENNNANKPSADEKEKREQFIDLQEDYFSELKKSTQLFQNKINEISEVLKSK